MVMAVEGNKLLLLRLCCHVGSWKPVLAAGGWEGNGVVILTP